MTHNQCINRHKPSTIINAMRALGYGERARVQYMTDKNAQEIDDYIGENMADEWDN